MNSTLEYPQDEAETAFYKKQREGAIRESSITEGLSYGGRNLERLCDAISSLEERLRGALLSDEPSDLNGAPKEMQMSEIGSTLSSGNIEVEGQIQRLIRITNRIDL